MHGLFVEDNIQGHKKVKFFGLQKQIAVLLALQDAQDFALFEYYGEIFRWAEIIDPLVHRLAVGFAAFFPHISIRSPNVHQTFIAHHR